MHVCCCYSINCIVCRLAASKKFAYHFSDGRMQPKWERMEETSWTVTVTATTVTYSAPPTSRQWYILHSILCGEYVIYFYAVVTMRRRRCHTVNWDRSVTREWSEHSGASSQIRDGSFLSSGPDRSGWTRFHKVFCQSEWTEYYVTCRWL